MAKSAKKVATVSQSQQPTISVFFSQKPSAVKDSSPIDLTLDSDEDAPPKKRQKTNANIRNLLESPTRVAEAMSSRSQNTSHAEQWRFGTTSPDKHQVEKQSHTAAEEAARKKNHEAFKMRLLGENSTFIQKKARESSAAAMDVDSDHPTVDEMDHSNHDSDSAFASFQELLSKKRGKGKAPTAHDKRADEMGPSGQTWTPLEKQV
jgi:DNA mismatch repair protein MSH3